MGVNVTRDIFWARRRIVTVMYTLMHYYLEPYLVIMQYDNNDGSN